MKNYLSLFLPILIVISLIGVIDPFIGNNQRLMYPIFADVIKGMLLVYYLRLRNNGTPLINTLTIVAILMVASDYLFAVSNPFGKYIFVLCNVSFIILFLFRQKLKSKKDKLSTLKVFSVFTWAFANCLYILFYQNSVLVILGILTITITYFYDRVIKIRVMTLN